MDLSTIQFGSLFSYSPHGNSDSEMQSKKVMRSLKTDQFLVSNPPILMSDFISDTIKKYLAILPFAHFLQINPKLVPIPKSSLMQPGTLWVPQRLANALIRNGFGKTVEECLKRVKPLPKSATSKAEDRPKAIEHYKSIEVQTIFPESEEILLIDDVVTRGATIVGAANKLHDAFPRAHIGAFAAMRAISSPGDFKNVYDPCEGKITLIDEETWREP